MAERFKIIERLAKGGMAEVFRGVSESLRGFKKAVAIKRILPHLAENETFVSMFLDEARLSLYLQHANIVHVFDVGESGGTYFLVMEYVNGADLKTVMEHLKQQGRRVPISEALYMMIESCKGLQYAHNLEHPETLEPLHIVHRDISPPNLLLSKNGEVKVVDFGLAKAGSQLEETNPGVVKGKFSYLAPEAARGEDVDHRADIFAVGIILYEMLTGRRLFYGDTDYETVQLVREARVPSIQAQNPKVEPELESIVRKALARDPAHRYQEAFELGDALAQYLFSRGMKVTARSIANLVRAVREERVRESTGRHSIVDAVVQQEMDALATIMDTAVSTEIGAANPFEAAAEGSPEPSAPPDGGSFIDTSNWAEDLGFDDLGGDGDFRFAAPDDKQSDAGGPAAASAAARSASTPPSVPPPTPRSPARTSSTPPPVPSQRPPRKK